MMLICLVMLFVTIKAKDGKSTHHMMEKMERHIARGTFIQRTRSMNSELHELVFAVQQRNLDVLEELLIEHSTPGSSTYQQWLTFDEVGKLSSNVEGSDLLVEWLERCGAVVTWRSVHGNYIKATTSIGTWEKLLDTTFYEWEDISKRGHWSSKRRVIHRALEYSLPREVREHVAAVFNTVQTPPVFSPKFRRRFNSGDGTAVTKEGGMELFKSHLRVSAATSAGDNGACNGAVTVACLNAVYRISSNLGSANLSQSVFETADQHFSQRDLLAFQRYFGLARQEALAPFGFETSQCSLEEGRGNDCSEGNLDLQYIMGVAQRTATVYWYVPDDSSTDPFVAWITDVADEHHPPQSNSVSWGAIEAQESPAVMDAFNVEAMKLANMGVTVTVASGDDGASNEGYVAKKGGWTCLCGSYNPSFPATSPYVTAVGATMGPERGGPEVTCQSDGGGVITSGGGFSQYFRAGSWQRDAATAYFERVGATEKSPVSGYNRRGRGYPDMSLLGAEYQVVIDGQLLPVFGTSASAPVLAAFVSLVNAARLSTGLPSVGFLNPTLYAIGGNSSSVHRFNDVTAGHNKCCAHSGSPKDAVCCPTGFDAAEGWDPATGWGSMNFDTFAAVFSVAAPYHVRIPPPDLLTTIIALLVVLAVPLGALSAAAYFAWWWCARRRGSDVESDANSAGDYSPPSDVSAAPAAFGTPVESVAPPVPSTVSVSQQPRSRGFFPSITFGTRRAGGSGRYHSVLTESSSHGASGDINSEAGASAEDGDGSISMVTLNPVRVQQQSV